MKVTEEKLEQIYRFVRIAIFCIPLLVVAVGIYLVLFPVDDYKYFSTDPKRSKFEISKNQDLNSLSFGVFPTRAYRYIKLSMDFKESDRKKCQNAVPEVTLSKTYSSFLYPSGDAVSNEDMLRGILFAGNKTGYPNGSLLHLKPTNEVFLIAHGKKILFPGPEIFQAFGYSFDNLIDVEQSEIDEFPDADQNVFLWSMNHPDGTIFQSFPSHSLFIVSDGKKLPIESKTLLDNLWPKNFSIPVSDIGSENILGCSEETHGSSVSCQLDASKLPSIGRYYFFSVIFPEDCPIDNIHTDDAKISFFSERSLETMKGSAKNIASSVLNRYFYKQ